MGEWTVPQQPTPSSPSQHVLGRVDLFDALRAGGPCLPATLACAGCEALEVRVRQLEERLDALERERALRARAAELGLVLPGEGGGRRG